jgi:hypothetical protein
MRVLHIAYQQLRRFGKTRVSWAQKLSYGLIKNDHYVLDFSDRDIAAFEAPFGIRDLGHGKANKRLLETVDAFQPDLIIAGHCDIIKNETFLEIRARHPHIVIAHCNLDPLFMPDNVEKIKHRAEIVDASFVSTGRRELRQFEGSRARIYHFPNPVEPAIETGNNSIKSSDELEIDLIFCSNSDERSKRLQLVKYLKENLSSDVNFKNYGSFGEPPIWGRDYDNALINSKMALNLNRQEGDYWYSSERMVQLAGNGLLTFTHAANKFDELFPEESLVYFNDKEELKSLIEEFNQDDAKRMAWASKAREFVHQELNTKLFSQYIVEASMQIPFSHDYVWAQDINLDGSMK